MQTSESIKEISGAFLNAQTEIEAAVKGSKNPFFHSNYADLNSVMSACKEQLNKHGIAILQPVVGDVVETVLIHANSGEWFRSETKIVNAKPNDPQAQGSAITYARRYGLQSMVFIGAEDDDGERAVDRTVDRTPAQTEYATEAQVNAIKSMYKMGRIDKDTYNELPKMTKSRASQVISEAKENQYGTV
jgi:hypothetical protein